MTFKNSTLVNEFFWQIAIWGMLGNSFFLVISLYELYQIVFTTAEKLYPWGADSFPWYYETKMTYLIYNGFWTVLFLVILFFQIYFAFKKNKRRELYSGLIGVMLFVTMLIANGL